MRLLPAVLLALASCATAPTPPPPQGTAVEVPRFMVQPVARYAQCPDTLRGAERLSDDAPEYPPEALEKLLEGSAAARCILSTDGALRGCEVLYAPTLLRASFLALLARQRFTPVVDCGVPRDFEVLTRYQFELPPEVKAGLEAHGPQTGARPGSGSLAAFDGERMTRPVMLSGRKPAYTRKALEQRVQGLGIYRCILSRYGTVDGCWVLRSIPLMDASVLGALSTHRYQPVTLDGQPIDVEYTFNVRMTLPR